MYVIIQKDNNLVVSITANLEVNDDGSFTDLNEGVIYCIGDFDYYSDVEVPGGINKGQYFYTPEEGFKLAFSNYDIMRARVHLINVDTKAQEYLNDIIREKNSFITEKATLEKNIQSLKANTLTADEKITLLESVVCDLYELLLTLQEENTNA